MLQNVQKCHVDTRQEIDKRSHYTYWLAKQFLDFLVLETKEKTDAQDTFNLQTIIFAYFSVFKPFFPWLRASGSHTVSK